MRNLATIAALTVAAVYGIEFDNPAVSSPKNMTYNAGMKVPITWTEPGTSLLNIDLVNMYRNVLDTPYSIALAVPAKEGVYMWEIPSDLKTAVGYQIRVWGAYQPKSIDNKGNSDLFTIFNDIPNAVNNFIVTSPSKSEPCHLEAPCKVTWDYPATVNAPADVDVALYRVGEPLPILKLATVKAADKEYIWEVPNDQSLMDLGNVFISVDGSGVAHEAPKMASNMGANSEAFKIAAQLPPPPKDLAAEEAKQKEEEEAAKAEEEKKRKEEEEKAEAEKEEEEKEKKEKEQKAKNKNAASTSSQVALTIAVLTVMVAALPFF